MRVIRSLQFRLSLFLALAILVAAIAAGAFAWRDAYGEAHELQDDVLRQIATLMDRQRLSPTPLSDPGRPKESDEISDVIVQSLGAEKPKPGDLPLPASLAIGFQDVSVGDKAYRVFVQTMAAGARIAVAQDGAFRDQIARDAARRALAPFLLLLPLLLAIVAVLVRGLVQPIKTLAQEVDWRDADDLRSIPESRAPSEIAPFIAAINRLLLRLAGGIEAQRRFVADAAHELRSPMTALALQAERLDQPDLPAATREKIKELRQGVARGRQLLDQLLTLARAQMTPKGAKAPISVQIALRNVMEILLPLAEAKDLDIGVEGAQDAFVQAEAIELATLVRNLVDNAIRYTPRGGKIDLSVSGDKGFVVLSVRDTGPGIKPEKRARVFDPFYRVLGREETGSGLGLSIVKTIAEKMGGSVELDFADTFAHKGLCVRVTLPRGKPAAYRAQG